MSGERRASIVAGASFLVSGGAAVAFVAAYVTGAGTQALGGFLALALAGLGAGLATLGLRLSPEGPYEEPRRAMVSPPAERKAFAAEVGRGAVERRWLVRLLGAAGAAVGLAALVPLRSLAPRPAPALRGTPWRAGLRLVTADGRPVAADSVPVESLLTVFPEGHTGSADGQVVLIRVRPDLIAALPGRGDWSPLGFVAYSKVCTHAGCPVGLYQSETFQLLCPCHQSAFDVLAGAEPVSGPAARRLPQLPLGIEDGFLVAAGGFPEPIGPTTWRVT